MGNENQTGISFKVGHEEIKYKSINHMRRAVDFSGIEAYMDSLGVDNKFEKLMLKKWMKIEENIDNFSYILTAIISDVIILNFKACNLMNLLLTIEASFWLVLCVLSHCNGHKRTKRIAAEWGLYLSTTWQPWCMGHSYMNIHMYRKLLLSRFTATCTWVCIYLRGKVL